MTKTKIWHKKRLSPLVLLFIGGVITTAGDIVAAEWVRAGGVYLYLLVMTLYLIGTFFLLDSYQSEDIAVASTLLVIFNVSTLVVAGMIIFGEELSPTKVIGIMLGLVAVVLLELGKKKSFFLR